MHHLTTCLDLARVLADLTGVGVSGVQARDAMHRRGWTRYESLSPEDLGALAVDILLPSGWVDLPCGGRVLLRDGRPVRVSDRGRDDVTEEQVLRDLAALGWPTAAVGDWSVSDDRDATAPVV